MRAIKFRAWDESLGRMVFCPTLEYRKDGTVFSNNFDSYGKLVERPLMQFTGLKDKNGVDIYEGDVVQYFYEPWNCGGLGSEYKNHVIKFEDGEFKVNRNRTQVIGNIHENPDLVSE